MARQWTGLAVFDDWAESREPSETRPVLEALLSLLEEERPLGEPLPWSRRARFLDLDDPPVRIDFLDAAPMIDALQLLAIVSTVDPDKV